MFKYFQKKKSQDLLNKSMIYWLEDLEDLISLIQYDLDELKTDLEDLTDFVEAELD